MNGKVREAHLHHLSKELPNQGFSAQITKTPTATSDISARSDLFYLERVKVAAESFKWDGCSGVTLSIELS